MYSQAASARSSSRTKRAHISNMPNVGHPLHNPTAMWKGFKFTHVKDAGKFAGWEAACYEANHSVDRLCRRTLRFKNEAQQDEVLRKLYWWCLAGQTRKSREDHKAVPCDGPDKDISKLPSLADIAVESDKRPKRRRLVLAVAGCEITRQDLLGFLEIPSNPYGFLVILKDSY